MRAGALLVLAFATTAFAQADPALVQAATDADKKATAVAVIDLARPGEFVHGHNLDADWSPASVIKVAVMVGAYAKDDLDAKVTIAKKNVTDTWVPPGDTRPYLRAGDVKTVRELVELMITRSDNVATNQLIDVLGRTYINDTLKKQGLDGLVVRHKLSGGAVSVDDPEATGKNSMRVGPLAKLLARIARRTLLSREASAAMEQHLLGQLHQGYIRKGLPSDVTLAWKSGSTSTISSAAGIARGPSRQYVIVAFSTWTSSKADVELAKLAKTIDAAFQKTMPWVHAREWRDEIRPGVTYAREFQNVVRADAEARLARNERWTPAQLPLHLVVKFAKDHQLEVRIKVGGNDVSSRRFSSLKSFLAVVDAATPADLVASSVETSAAPGDFAVDGSDVTVLLGTGRTIEGGPPLIVGKSFPATARRFSFLAGATGITGALSHP